MHQCIGNPRARGKKVSEVLIFPNTPNAIHQTTKSQKTHLLAPQRLSLSQTRQTLHSSMSPNTHPILNNPRLRPSHLHFFEKKASTTASRGPKFCTTFKHLIFQTLHCRTCVLLLDARPELLLRAVARFIQVCPHSRLEVRMWCRFTRQKQRKETDLHAKAA